MVNPPIGPEGKVRLPQSTWDNIDKLRGRRPRSEFLREYLTREFDPHTYEYDIEPIDLTNL